MRLIFFLFLQTLFVLNILGQRTCLMNMGDDQLNAELDLKSKHNVLFNSLMNKKVTETFSDENLIYLLNNLQNRNQLNFVADSSSNLKNVSLGQQEQRVAYLHVINLQDDSGNGGMNIEEFERVLLVNAQESFKDLNLIFEICEFDNHRDSEIYSTSFDRDDRFIESSGLQSKYEYPDRINIFLADNSTHSWSCFPGMDYNHLVINTGQAYDIEVVLAHEIGHYFHLFHTFETFAGAEYVDGSNCSTSGDFICDTAADRWDLNVNKQNCSYNGKQMDDNGDYYKPPSDNIMSYHFPCPYQFTPGQIYRMNINLLEYRYDVLRKCDKETLFEEDEEIVFEEVTDEDDVYNEMLEYLLKNYGSSNQRIELANQKGFGYAFESSPEVIESSISMLKKHNLFSGLKIKN